MSPAVPAVIPKRQAGMPSPGASHKSPARANPIVVRSLCGIVRSSLMRHRSPGPIAPGEGEYDDKRRQDDTESRDPPALPPRSDIAQNHTQRHGARTGSQMHERHPSTTPFFDRQARLSCTSVGKTLVQIPQG
jgi:hypothetical protein